MSKIEEFLPEVLIELNQVPRPLALYTIKAVLREFTQASHWLRFPIETPYIAGFSEVEIDMPTGEYTLNKVFYLEGADGQEIAPITVPELAAYSSGWRNDTCKYPRFYMMSFNDVLTLYPRPTSAGTLRGVMSVMTRRDVSTFSDSSILDKWIETIGYGAKARLMAKPGEPWTNPEMASVYFKMFKEGIGRAKMEANKDHTIKALVMRGHSFDAIGS